MDNLASILTALSLVIVAITGLYTAIRVNAVHREVRTGNGQTLGALADIAEGRAAEAIPVADRSAAEQEHVEMKQASENRGEP